MNGRLFFYIVTITTGVWSIFFCYYQVNKIEDRNRRIEDAYINYSKAMVSELKDGMMYLRMGNLAGADRCDSVANIYEIKADSVWSVLMIERLNN